jgi:hypothetical protein
VNWSGANSILLVHVGTISNLAGGVFDAKADGALAHSSGVSTFRNLGVFRKSGGAGATTVVLSTFDNAGTVDAQSGTTVFGSYSQTGGRLQFGLSSLTNFGQMRFAQTVALTGTLAANLVGGFRPKAGDAFTVISYFPSSTGGFAAFDLPGEAAWQTNSSIYGANTITLTVLNARPTIPAIADRTIDEETLLSFTAVGSEPDAGQTLSYALLNPPAHASIHTSSGLFSWTPSEAQGPATNVIAIRVTDNGTPSLNTTGAFTVVVREVNRAPTLAAIADHVVVPGHTLTITSAASDPDWPPNALRFSLPEHPSGAGINDVSGVLTWTTRSGDAGGASRFTVIVRDEGAPSLSATQSFRVTVLPLPRLAIGRTGEGVQISWPALYTDYVLQATTNLSFPAGWAATTNTASLVGTNRVVVDAPTAPEKFYQLRHP